MYALLAVKGQLQASPKSAAVLVSSPDINFFARALRPCRRVRRAREKIGLGTRLPLCIKFPTRRRDRNFRLSLWISLMHLIKISSHHTSIVTRLSPAFCVSLRETGLEVTGQLLCDRVNLLGTGQTQKYRFIEGQGWAVYQSVDAGICIALFSGLPTV